MGGPFPLGRLPLPVAIGRYLYVGMAYTVMAYIVIAYIVMAYMVMALYSYGQLRYVATVCPYTCLYARGWTATALLTSGGLRQCLYSYGLYKYGLYSYGLYSYGPI